MPHVSKPLTQTQKLDFLTMLAHGKNVKDACEAASIPRRNVYYWRSEDPDFAAAWKHAQDEWGEVLKSQAEEMLRNRAFDLNDKHSHILLIFLLKKLDPSYKENYKQEIVHKHDTSREYTFTPEEAAKAIKILEDITAEAASKSD